MGIILPADGWEARPYQRPFFNAMEKGCKRAFLVIHRRAGKGQCAVNYASMFSTQVKGAILHVFPTLKQGREVIWEGISDPPEGRPFLAAFPGYEDPDTKFEDPTRWVCRRRDDTMKLYFKNGSTYQIGGADQPDTAYRGTNPVLWIFDEYAKSAKMRTLYDRVARPIVSANGGTIIFLLTPDGKNHAWNLYQSIKDNPEWYVDVLTVDDTYKFDAFGRKVPVITPEAIQAERESGMSEALIQQEYFCNWEGPSEGAFYGDQMRKAAEEGRIGTFPYDEHYPVTTAWDLGIADFTSIWCIQEIRGRYRWIDYIEGRDLPFQEYLSILKSKPYVYMDHIGPHDIRTRDRASGNSAFEIARNFGFHFRVAPKLLISDGVSALRSIIPLSDFNEENCHVGIEGLKHYSRVYDKEHDEHMETPVHNRHSHPADAARTYAVARRQRAQTRTEPLRQRLSIA